MQLTYSQYQFAKAGNTSRQGLSMGQFQIGPLAVGWQPHADALPYKWKARTGGMLWLPCPLRAYL